MGIEQPGESGDRFRGLRIAASGRGSRTGSSVKVLPPHIRSAKVASKPSRVWAASSMRSPSGRLRLTLVVAEAAHTFSKSRVSARMCSTLRAESSWTCGATPASRSLQASSSSRSRWFYSASSVAANSQLAGLTALNLRCASSGW